MEKFPVLQSSKSDMMLKELSSEWCKKPQNVKKCGQLIDVLKMELTQLDFLPTGSSQKNIENLALARNVLEIAVEYSVVNKDLPAFERYIALIKSYYYDFKQIGESDNMYKVLGLNLLYLLSVNRVADFHVELELLSAEVIQNNKYIRPILALEQYIMEGRYNKIFLAKKTSPAEIYNYFMDMLVSTVRDEIGACIEKAYDKISIIEAAKRLYLNPTEMKAFGEKRNWVIGSDNFYNFTNKAKKPKEPLPAQDLAEHVISYARELEMIV